MRIGLPYAPRGGMGGGNRVLSLFEAYLDARELGWNRDVRACDVVLLNSWSSPLVTAAIAAGLGKPIVHRLDNAARAYGRTDDVDLRLQRINALASRSLFQSYAARDALQALDFVSVDGPVIYNPVDPKVFTPEGPPMELPAWTGWRVSCVAWSDNPMKGGPEIVALAHRYPTVQFVRAGRWPEQAIPSNVVDVGVLDASGVAALHRACDALLTLSQSEACPNHVLEAMACARPVIYAQTGTEPSATKELVGPCGLPSFLMTEYQQTLPELLESFREEKTGTAARQRILDSFTPERIFPQYLDLLEEALASQRGLMRRAWDALRGLV